MKTTKTILAETLEEVAATWPALLLLALAATCCLSGLWSAHGPGATDEIRACSEACGGRGMRSYSEYGSSPGCVCNAPETP